MEVIIARAGQRLIDECAVRYLSEVLCPGCNTPAPRDSKFGERPALFVCPQCHSTIKFDLPDLPEIEAPQIAKGGAL